MESNQTASIGRLQASTGAVKGCLNTFRREKQNKAKQALTQFLKTECVSWTPSEKGRGTGGRWHPAPGQFHPLVQNETYYESNQRPFSFTQWFVFTTGNSENNIGEIKITPNTITQRQPLWTLWYAIFQDHFIFKKRRWDHYLHPVLRPAFESAQPSCLSLLQSASFPSLLNCLSSLSVELRAFSPFSYTPVDFQCPLHPRCVWKHPGSRSESN